MPNAIKRSGEGLALQVTKPARAAGFVEENADGEPTRRAAVLVYAFDDTLLVFDADRVAVADRAELVASAARDTKSIYRAARASIQIAGHGYQVNLPPAEDAGFEEGDSAPAHPAPGVLVITTDERQVARLAADLVTIRREQVST
jgi:hypothetical protein